MNRFTSQLLPVVSVAVIAMGVAAQAHAANTVQPPPSITPVSTCGLTDIFGTGVTVNDCSGFYEKNLNKGENNTNFTMVKDLLQSEFAGVVLGNSILQQKDVSTGASFSFDGPYNLSTSLFGRIVLGVHWGGNDTAFYDVTLNPGITTFNIVLNNPSRSNGGGISNVALYGTNLAPVPEPETIAMLLAGLGVVAAAARRRLGKTPKH